MKWADGGILDELWREKFGYCILPVYSPSQLQLQRYTPDEGGWEVQELVLDQDWIYCGGPNTL